MTAAPALSHVSDWLVIGYGNELRRDDGLGPKLADAIARLGLPGVEVIRCHQLTPELAESISRSKRVVFIDASVSTAGDVEVSPLRPNPHGTATGHANDPCMLLALAPALYGSAPRAWWMTLPAFDLSYGEELSTRGHEVLAIGLAQFKRLWSNQRTEGDRVQDT